MTIFKVSFILDFLQKQITFEWIVITTIIALLYIYDSPITTSNKETSFQYVL